MKIVVMLCTGSKRLEMLSCYISLFICKMEGLKLRSVVMTMLKDKGFVKYEIFGHA